LHNIYTAGNDKVAITSTEAEAPHEHGTVVKQGVNATPFYGP